MYIDSKLELSVGQALTTAETTPSTNVYDTGSPVDIGVGLPPLKLRAFVDTAFTGGTSIAVKLQTSADNSTWVDLLTGPTVALAALTVGKELLVADVPKGAKRYLRAAYVVTGTMTAGKVSSALVLDVDGNNRGNVPSGIPAI